MKRIGQRTRHVTPSLPKQDGAKMFREKSAEEAENFYFGEQGNFVRQGFVNLGWMKNCIIQYKK